MMDQSYSGSDISLSPSQILERLQTLRQLQLFQRGKLQKQCLQFSGTPETSSSITEIVSHFSNSTTSYNTFQSLLFSPDKKPENDPINNSNLHEKLKEKDLIEGVSVLNLSQESEFIVNSPVSCRSKVSESTNVAGQITSRENKNIVSSTKKQISLEEIPILAPKNNFEELVIEKLENEGAKQKVPTKSETKSNNNNKKTFLKKGEGMVRFGLRKNDLVIQNTKALPWRNKEQNKNIKNKQKPMVQNNNTKPVEIDIIVNEPKTVPGTNLIVPKSNIQKIKPKPTILDNSQNAREECLHESSKDTGLSLPEKIIQLPVGKHPLLGYKTKSWASIFTKEKDDFLKQLKQSDYYKNFASPAKSNISDASCNESSRNAENRENLEQRMFELIENKVSNDSFSIENSFFDKFLRRSNLETTGESTPITIQKCLSENPELAHIFPKLMKKKKSEPSHSDVESCNSEYTECCSDESSVASTCSTCNTVEETNQSSCIKDKAETKKVGNKFANSIENKENQKPAKTGQSQDDNEIGMMKANLVEMNEKLVETSELLKERLRELEDEIETFRKENVNLNKIREEVDLERQKFYEEKQCFEQKFNEEKILSEYYLAEEKEKLSKQKQMYERYVREMRGKLNKKEKDEVVNLKKEISDIKDEMRLKDAKSTATIARLRNQLKLMEKEKHDLHAEIEKLKRENKKIQHSNDITRRVSNMKYLEEINKKLTQINNKTTQSEGDLDTNIKYKAFEIERQSRSRKVQPVNKNMRPRAKSVPNLNVKSRYAKYFSQRDVVSQIDKDNVGIETYDSDNESKNSICSDEIELQHDKNDTFEEVEEENNLEKVYLERFQTTSPISNRSSLSKTSSFNSLSNLNDNGFFVRKTSKPTSKSPNNRSISPNTYDLSSNCRLKSPVHSQKSNLLYNENEKPNIPHSTCRSKSPISILSNRSTFSQKPPSIRSHGFNDKTMSVSPEPTSATSVAKSNLNPTEIKKPDGSRELRFPNGNIKYISVDGKYSKFVYYNGDIKETFYNEGRIKYFYEQSKTYHTTHADGLEVLEFPDGQVEKRYKDGSSEVRLPNGSVRYFDPKNPHVREEWRFPDGAVLTVAATGEKRINFANGQVEVHAQDHKRREFPDGTVKLVYNDGTSETRYASGRIRIKDKHGNLIMDSAPG